MKQFFKTMLASTVGVFIAMGIIIFIMISVFAGMLVSSSSSTAYTPKPNTVLKLDLRGVLAEQVQENPFSSILGEDVEKLSVADIVKAIRKAKDCPEIVGIYMNASSLSGGFASMETIRRELESFKESDKFIVAYSDAYTQGTYYLSSVADSIFLNPQGSVALTGLSSQGVFFTGLAEKLGVKYEIFKVGTFKSAVEPYMLKEFSDANREQLTSFLNDIWYHILENVSKSRSVDIETLNKYLNEGLAMGEAENALQYKLADALSYRHDAENSVKRLAGQDVDGKLKSASVKNMLNIVEMPETNEDKVAILYAEGSIMPESAQSTMSGEALITEKMVDEIYKLKGDKSVKAVVFRVNSPGGSAYISEQIWKAVVDLKAEKPIVVSMGDYAASGGYYISCAANKIVAEPTTLTGSIGVFGTFPVLAGTMDKIGVTTDVVKTNNFADMGNMLRPMRDDERILIQRSIERTYDLFLTRCADGRGKSKEAIDEIGQGRVWTGAQALERGLVDRLGGVDVAIEEAAALAGITKYNIFTANKPKDLITELMESMKSDAEMSFSRYFMSSEELNIMNAIREAKAVKGIQARMPFTYQGL